MLTQEYLKSRLNYDSSTGIFTWKGQQLSSFKRESRGKVWNIRYANKHAGTVDLKGYIGIVLDYKRYYAHRLAWFYIYGEFPSNQVDHIDSIKNNNCIANLRIANNSENHQNQIKALKHNKSTGLLGASFCKQRQKFIAQIAINGQHFNLGGFDTAEQAHKKYIETKRNLHPFNQL